MNNSKKEQSREAVPLLTPGIFNEILKAIVDNATRDLRQAKTT